MLCEVRAGPRGRPGRRVEPRLQKDLSTHHEGLRFIVRRVETGLLPRFELKAKRVKDDRVVKGSGS